MTHAADHWENVYRSKNFDAVSWYALPSGRVTAPD